MRSIILSHLSSRMRAKLSLLVLWVSLTAHAAQGALCFSLTVAADDPANWPAPYTILAAPASGSTSPDSPQVLKIVLNPEVLHTKPYGGITKIELITFKSAKSEERKKFLLIQPPQGLPSRVPEYCTPTSAERKQMFFQSRIESIRPIAESTQILEFEMTLEESDRTALVIDQPCGPCAAGSLAFFLIDTPSLPPAPSQGTTP